MNSVGKNTLTTLGIAVAALALVCPTSVAQAQSRRTNPDCSSSAQRARFVGQGPIEGIAFDHPDNWTFDAANALLGPPGGLKPREGRTPWIVCGVQVWAQLLQGSSPRSAIREAHADALKRNGHLRQDGAAETIYRDGMAIVLTRFAHRSDAVGEEREGVTWASVFTAASRPDADTYIPVSGPRPSQIYNLVLTGPSAQYADLERTFTQLIASLRLSAAVPARASRRASSGSDESVPLRRLSLQHQCCRTARSHRRQRARARADRGPG
jgi:hypothetical protein